MLKVFVLIVFSVLSLSCGYTTGSLLPAKFKTIHIEPFKNNVQYTIENQRKLYVPLLEVKVRDAITNRFLFDGNLKPVDKSVANLVLKGQLTGFERDVLRSSDDENAEEYRIHIVVSLELWDVDTNELMWSESSFVGETTYFTTGSLAKTESTAIVDALTDLARRTVERTIEDW